MERTLDVMMEELRLVKEEKKPLSEAMKAVDNKINNLEKRNKDIQVKQRSILSYV